MEELASVFQRRFVDDDGNAFGLDALHDALDGGCPEVVGIALHGQAVDADHVRVACDDRVRDKVLAGGVTFNNSFDQVLRHVPVVGQ